MWFLLQCCHRHHICNHHWPMLSDHSDTIIIKQWRSQNFSLGGARLKDSIKKKNTLINYSNKINKQL